MATSTNYFRNFWVLLEVPSKNYNYCMLKYYTYRVLVVEFPNISNLVAHHSHDSTPLVKEKQGITFFHGKLATLERNPDWWWWVEVSGSSTIPQSLVRSWLLLETMGPRGSLTSDKATCLGNARRIGLKFGMWLTPAKRSPSMRSIWHKAIAITEWKANIAPHSISKRRVICIPNSSELVKHKFWDCTHVRCA